MFSSHGHIPMRTSTIPPTSGYVGLCLCLWWMDILGGCHCSAKEILNHYFLGWQKETFLSLVNHNLSLLSWCKPDLQSVDSGHGVTFDVNTSFIEVTKAYTSYLKNKKGKNSLTSKGGQASRYVGQFYQVWDEYFWMTPEKGQLINYSCCYMLGTKRTKGRLWWLFWGWWAYKCV